jgi:hypothetical protein
MAPIQNRVVARARNACRLIYRMLVTRQLRFDEAAFRRGELSRERQRPR